VKKSAQADVFVAHVVESLRELGAVETKRMFGAWGLYHRGAFFALVSGGTLYLKTDERNRAEFDALGLEPFTFVKGGETIVTGYRAAPEEALEDPRVMARWARSAYEAALRKRAAKR
jgi:DNA transformation protein